MCCYLVVETWCDKTETKVENSGISILGTTRALSDPGTFITKVSVLLCNFLGSHTSLVLLFRWFQMIQKFTSKLFFCSSPYSYISCIKTCYGTVPVLIDEKAKVMSEAKDCVM